MRMSICDWHMQQYFSHSHLSSGISHCMQRVLAFPGVAMATL
jgi:hypothetical protein